MRVQNDAVRTLTATWVTRRPAGDDLGGDGLGEPLHVGGDGLGADDVAR